MLKQNRKVKAFTLSEIIVVLILTSIIVGLAFSVLNLVQKHMLNIQNNFRQTTEFQKLKTSLWLDFNRYSEINFDDQNEELKFVSKIDSTRYVFHENMIIKDRDTFKTKFKNKMFFLKGIATENGQVDALKFMNVKEQNDNASLFIFSRLDSKTTMEYGF